MKQRMPSIALPLLFAVVFPLFLQAPAFGQENPKAPFTVARLVTASGVVDREPSGVAETFPALTGQVYCFLEAVSITADTEVTFLWMYEGKEAFRLSLPLKEGARWRTHSSVTPRGRKGSWKVDLLDAAGAVVQSISFTVQ